MSILELIALVSNSLGILAIIGLGILYSFRKRLMPYHIEILDKSWEKIDPNFQFLFCKLLNGAGYSCFAYGLTLLAMFLLYIVNLEGWGLSAISVLGLIGTFPLLIIVLEVKNRTSASPPLKFAIAVNILFVVGLIFSVLLLIFQ